MSKKTIRDLVETRKRILKDVEEGKLSVGLASRMLGITRQGLWKLRKSVTEHGESAITGRKRGPKSYHTAHNKTPLWVEDTVERLFTLYGVGSDRLVWLLEDSGIEISRATVYRILIRRRLFFPHQKAKRLPVTLYTKGYPGEEVQVDTTLPFGKHGPVLISAVDDHSRWGLADCYTGNTSFNASVFLRKLVRRAPFPIKTIRTDNGSEFKKEFTKACKELGVEIIRNPVRHPTSNGKVERLHRTIEEECLWRVQAHKENLEYTRYWLTRYFAWYNTKRRHGGYGMNKKTPQEKLEAWILQQPTSSLPDVNETLILYIN